ncbi:zinc finger MYM-type protein 1-like isoform X2 [Arctopsyche grandis]|uniref:zinc finger MYM-type protein 1-like isoform X2 n=1 Tax=Arctopsyche grandis TaxID=121162 RepID=UPI00406D84D6
MECRLCLGSAPAESFVSIFGDPHPERLVQSIRTCCQIQVKRGDGLPDTVCLSCETSLESLTTFRNACLKSNETSQLKLDECLKIKTEEVLLEDEVWDNASVANSPLGVCKSFVKDKADERDSSVFEPSDSKQNIQLIENVDSLSYGETAASCDYGEEIIDDHTMNEVDNLLKHSFASSSPEEKLEIIKLGAHQPRHIEISQRDGKVNRKFASTWFDKIAWLTVSEEKKSFFCFFCLLFGGESLWTHSGVSDLKHISERIRAHESTMNHINNAVKFKTFRKVNVLPTIDSGYRQSVSRHNELVDRNRHTLSRIIDCIKFCGIHDQPVLGHDETTQSNSRGVFLDLVELTLGDVLDDRLTSKTILNDLLDCMYDVYIEEIKSEMDRISFVSLQANETTNRSQFAIVLRYSKDSQPVERFLAYVDVDNRISCGLSKLLVEKLSPFNLNNKLIAQTYDGTAIMQASRNGVQNKIMRETYPHAHYMHYYAHQLKACSSISQIKHFFSSISGIGDFFNSPKRNNLLLKVCETLNKQIRWDFTSRIVNCVKENRKDLMKCFEVIQQRDGWDDKSICKAIGLMKCLKDDEFKFFLSFFHLVFNQVDILYDVLQSKKSTNMCAAQAFQNFETAIDQIVDTLRDFHRSSSSRKRPRRELNSMEIDELQMCVEEACIIIKDEMKNRLGNCEIFKSFAVVDPMQFKIYKEKFPIEHINVLKRNYPMLRTEKLKSELLVVYSNDLFKDFSNTNELCKFITDSDLKDTLSEVLKLIEIVLVTPVTTVDAERSFDMLKRIKTHVNNTICQDRLNALAVLSIHKDCIQQISFFNKKVIEKFVSMKEGWVEYLYK